MNVLITGAGSGLGHAFARLFRADGDRVIGCDVSNLDALREVCDVGVECDVTDPVQVASLVKQAGDVDVLVANAGLGRRASVEDAAWADIEDVIRVNLLGVIHCARAVLPVMRARGRGRIVNVCSRNAEFCPAGLVGYNTSKAGVAAFTRTLSRELDGTDILVNNLIPGPSRTAMNPRGTRPPDEAYPTVRMLATLPPGGPSGRTFFDEKEYPLFKLFVEGP